MSGFLTETTHDGVEVYANEIYSAIQDYIDRALKDDPDFDIYKINQMRWNAVLIFIYNNVFKNTGKLKRKPYDDKNFINGNLSNNNAYNIELLNRICDIYVLICYEYAKECSIKGFCRMVGIEQSCIYAWAGNDGYAPRLKASSSGLEIYKKLTAENEESLHLLSYDSRYFNAAISALNRRYGWAQPGVTREQGKQQLNTSDALRIVAELAQDPPKSLVDSTETGRP